MKRASTCAFLLLLSACRSETVPPDLRDLALPDPDVFAEPARGELTAAREELDRLLRDHTVESERLAEAIGELGMLHQRYEYPEVAKRCYLRARRLVPSEARWPYLLGYLLQERGDLDGAAVYLREALGLEGETAAKRIRLADVERGRGDLEVAEGLYVKALEQSPQAPAALYGLGQVAVARQRWGSAIEFFEGALAAAPEASQVHHTLARALRTVGDDEGARQALARAGSGQVPRSDPLIAELLVLGGEQALRERAQTAARTGDPTAALAALEALVEASPRDLAGNFNLAVAYQRRERAADAERQYRRVLEIDPDHAPARFNLGSLLAENGRLEQAVAELRRLVELAPDAIEARFNLAAALSRMGRWREATDEYAQVVRLDPSYRDVETLYANALLEAGRPDQAAQAFRRLVEEQPEALLPRLKEAESLARASRWQEAQSALEEGVEQMPHSGELLHALARVLVTSPVVSLRDPERAVDLAEAVYRARPTSQHADTLAMALEAVGRPGDARALRRDLHRDAPGVIDEQ